MERVQTLALSECCCLHFVVQFVLQGVIFSEITALCLMSTMNFNEAIHSLLNRMSEYRLTNNRGLPLLDLETMLERLDEEYSVNVSGVLGIQYFTTPFWRSSPRRRANRSADCTLLVNGVYVPASEP